jgi:hypothetical protein
MKFDVVMMTFDRSPRTNYLQDTVNNLLRAGVFESSRLHSFTLADSGSPTLDVIQTAFENVDYDVYVATGQRTPTQNAAYALSRASNMGADWVLFLEDDIDVCNWFLESAAGWLEDHIDMGHRVFPLGANYADIEGLVGRSTCWTYPIAAYYGTLAVAMRSNDARSIAEHLAQIDPEKATYDLFIAQWAAARGIREFLTPVPSFVQHLGQDSSIRPGGEFHQYRSWPGRQWSYARRTP